MRKVLFAGLVALLIPTASLAQVQLGLRLGYAPAMGDAAKDAKMTDFSLSSQIPIQVDAAYKFNADFSAGLYFSYGFGQVDNKAFESLVGQQVCGANGITCSGSALRFGAQGNYTFNQVTGPIVPWAGLFLGYESVTTDLSGGGSSGSIELTGYELGLQVGGDYKVNEQFSVGPYLTYSFGQYQNVEAKVNGQSFASGSITDQAMHSWLSIGVMGRFNL
ncbi:MAG TPA: hypothetical protein VF875_18610 [Anaeromyxobacter sp.]